MNPRHKSFPPRVFFLICISPIHSPRFPPYFIATMSSTPKQNVKDRAKSAPRSKNLPWFQANIGSSLTPEGRQLLEEYSGIPPEEVVAHIYNTVSLLLFSFPFLHLSLSSFSIYNSPFSIPPHQDNSGQESSKNKNRDPNMRGNVA